MKDRKTGRFITYVDITGQKFNMLLAVKFIGKSRWGDKQWEFICDCGNKTICSQSSVKQGKTKSCGCLVKKVMREMKTTHNSSNTRFYHIYKNMEQRCNNINPNISKNWGARGIKCLWKSFEEFRDDMYESYEQHVQKFGAQSTTIDRIDNNGNYCLENCRWATRKEQAQNMRTTHKLTFRGDTKTLSEWADIVKISRITLYKRIFRRGWSIEKAFTTTKKVNQYS